MRAVVQRVTRASVAVDSEIVGEIDRGLLVLLGVTHADKKQDADYLIDKIVTLRIFDDADGKMNRSLADTGAGMLIVSQFTLYGDTRGGRRPSFIAAAPGGEAKELYEYFVTKAKEETATVATGEFGAMMDVELVNCGPVTILLDSEKTI